MIAQELSVGNWIYNKINKRAEQIQMVDETGVMLDYNDIYLFREEDIGPLPINDTFLHLNFPNYTEKTYREIGTLMVRTDEKYWYLENDNDKERGPIYFKIKKGPKKNKYQVVREDGHWVADVEFVHDLQNLMRLLKINKEINQESLTVYQE